MLTTDGFFIPSPMYNVLGLLLYGNFTGLI